MLGWWVNHLPDAECMTFSFIFWGYRKHIMSHTYSAWSKHKLHQLHSPHIRCCLTNAVLARPPLGWWYVGKSLEVYEPHSASWGFPPFPDADIILLRPLLPSLPSSSHSGGMYSLRNTQGSCVISNLVWCCCCDTSYFMSFYEVGRFKGYMELGLLQVTQLLQWL